MLLCQLTWANSNRFAVVIGNNTGLDSSKSLKYAHRDAKKMYRVLTALGEFKPENTSLLLGKTATDVWKALKTIQKQAARRAPMRTMARVFLTRSL